MSAAKLTAGCVVLETAARPESRSRTASSEAIEEHHSLFAGGPLERKVFNRVVEHEVHVRLQIESDPSQGLEVLLLIIDSPKKTVFEGHAPAGFGAIRPARVENLRQFETLRPRNEP